MAVRFPQNRVPKRAPHRPGPRNPRARSFVSPYSILPGESRRWSELFAVGAVLLIIHYLQLGAHPLSTLGALLIAFAALLPAFLWCTGRADGLPIVPLFSSTFLTTYSYPLVSGHLSSAIYEPYEHFTVAVKVSLFLYLLTIGWYGTVRGRMRPPRSYYKMSENNAVPFFLSVMAVATLFQMAYGAGWVWMLPGGAVSILRGVVLGLNLLAVFSLAYRIGQSDLRARQMHTFFLIYLLQFLATAVRLLLITPSAIAFLGIVGFTISRRKVPLKTVLCLLVVLAVLQSGKTEMRRAHWSSKTAPKRTVSPMEYGKWFTEWGTYGLKAMKSKPVRNVYFEEIEETPVASIAGRSSVVHLMLMVQSRIGRDIDYLYGNSYEVLPSLIVPRIINPNKVTSHEGTHRLNVHFGLQDRESTRKTTIGWGILNEAYANFGVPGIIGLAMLLSFLLGKVTAWSMYTPILSARTLWAIIILSTMIQTEWTAGVFVASLSQAGFVLLGLTYMTMKVHRFPTGRNAFREGGIRGVPPSRR